MPTDYIPQNDLAFQQWAANFMNAATEEMSFIHLTTADITLLTTRLNAFTGDMDAYAGQEASYHSAVAAKNTSRQALEDDVRALVRRIQGYSDVTPAMKMLLGINPRTSGRTHGEPTEPLDLVVKGYSNGVNELFWKRNGNKPNTVFLVEAMTGTSTDFVQVGSLTGTRFKHDGQTPGATVTYRVFAQRDGETSAPSDTATVYPTNSTGTTLELRKVA